jgi:hypothetical protein
MFAVLGSASPSKVSANAALQASPVATAPAGQVTTVKCQPVQVSVSEKRVHVKCQEGVGDIVYFAAPTDDKGTAGNYLSIMLDALSGKKQLLIDVLMDDLTGEPYGCMNADCRPIGGIAIES